MGSKSYRPKVCDCGSGQPADPQIFNGTIVGFACKACENIKMAVYRPEVLFDKNFFEIPAELRHKDNGH